MLKAYFAITDFVLRRSLYDQNLRNKIKILHPVSEALSVTEKVPATSESDVLKQILNELKAIRKALEK